MCDRDKHEITRSTLFAHYISNARDAGDRRADADRRMKGNVARCPHPARQRHWRQKPTLVRMAIWPKTRRCNIRCTQTPVQALWRNIGARVAIERGPKPGKQRRSQNIVLHRLASDPDGPVFCHTPVVYTCAQGWQGQRRQEIARVDSRILALDGIYNFRDYGGYAVAGGRKLRTGLLWRSGQHAEATQADLDQVAALRLATVIDLRGNQERASFPCPRPLGFAAEVLFADGETAGGHAPHLEAAQAVVTAADAHARMAELYKTMPFRPLLVEVYRAYFAALARGSGASLLHCLAGKDRTGLAAALVHHLLGVHDDDIMGDYLLTNHAPHSERRIAAGAETVRGNLGAAMQDDAIRTIMSVHEDYLHTAFAQINEAHGSVRAYATAVLGVDDVMLGAMKTHLVS